MRMRGTEKEDAVLLSVSWLNTHCVVDVPMSMPTLSSCSSRIAVPFLSGGNYRKMSKFYQYIYTITVLSCQCASRALVF